MDFTGIVRDDLAEHVQTAANGLGVGMDRAELIGHLESLGCKHAEAAVHAAEVCERIDLACDLVVQEAQENGIR